MHHPATTEEAARAAAAGAPPAEAAQSALPLSETSDEAELLAFLAERPVHTVVMGGLIRDNGVESPFNRGTFYACRDSAGRLQGVALIGHAIFVEARTDAALAAFARAARGRRDAHMVMGESATVRRFWERYAGAGGQAARRFGRQLLFELRRPAAEPAAVEGLRRGELGDRPLLMPVQAELARRESGVSPLDVDPQGFRLRCARRVEQGRVFVLAESGALAFKVDVISETPECAYLEGVYVDPLLRGRGYASRCLSQVGRTLLEHAGAVCGLIDAHNEAALALARRAGYAERGQYETIFLARQTGGEG